MNRYFAFAVIACAGLVAVSTTSAESGLDEALARAPSDEQEVERLYEYSDVYKGFCLAFRQHVTESLKEITPEENAVRLANIVFPKQGLSKIARMETDLGVLRRNEGLCGHIARFDYDLRRRFAREQAIQGEKVGSIHDADCTTGRKIHELYISCQAVGGLAIEPQKHIRGMYQ